MLISCNWLERHVDLSGVDFHELHDRFTLTVAELEGIHHVGEGLDPIVVGRILEVDPIEGGGKNLRTLVDTGPHGWRQIVCGAPNTAVGQHVPVALPGCRFGELTIRETEVRGVKSAGMICSERELGISDDHSGILVLDGEPAPGTPLGDIVALTDTLLEIDNKSLTHRPDAWGHRGIAREIAAFLGRPLKPSHWEVPYTDDRPLTLRVDDLVACPRYTAVALESVTVAPSPLWLKALLHRVGVRPISNVVDLTNFVMLDVGHPLHAFDRRQLAGDTIIVRPAQPGERFTTLDGTERVLDERDVLIADAERGVALGGVMGGLNSEIVDDTTDIVLEAANFHPSTIRMTAQRLGLRTESSARFEKSLDPLLAEDASRAFCHLLLELDPAVRVASAFIDVCAELPPPPTIRLRVDVVRRRLGVELEPDQIRQYLERLEFGVTATDDPNVFAVKVPTFRATRDIGLEVDLIEELGRSYGYDNIVPTSPKVSLARPHPNRRKRFERALRTYLSKVAGCDEVQTYSFDSDPLLERIGAMPGARVELANPISAEMPALRTALAPNLLGVVERNDREHDQIRVYELGRVFHPSGGEGELPRQPSTLGIVLAEPISKDGDPQARLFASLKSIVDGLARGCLRGPFELEQGGAERVWAHPARQAVVRCGGQALGYIAELHPLTAKQLDLRKQVVLAEIDVDAWRATEARDLAYRPLPRFPAVYRDFAVVVPEGAAAGAVRSAIREAAPELISDVDFQSIYRGAGVAEGHKSLAWAVTMRREDRTLTDPEVREVEQAIWSSLAERVGGEPRA